MRRSPGIVVEPPGLGHMVGSEMVEGRPPVIEPEDASHLCGHTVCKTEGHVVWERPHENQLRKNCRVWAKCAHDDSCTLKVLVCPHWPKCLRFIDGVKWEDFVRDPSRYFHPSNDPDVRDYPVPIHYVT